MAMEKGQVSGLKAIFDDKADNTLVQWSSEDENVARVDAVGRVSAVGRRPDANHSHRRERPDGQRGHQRACHRQRHAHHARGGIRGRGGQVDAGRTYIPADTTDEVASWASSDQSVLSVQRNGTLRAVAEGQAGRSVCFREGLSASTVVRGGAARGGSEISPPSPPSRRSTPIPEPRFFDAQGNVDANSSSHLVTWTSSNPAIATVEDGVVTALKSGSARISAAADGKIASSVMCRPSCVRCA